MFDRRFNVARGFLEAKAKKVILVSYEDERGSEAVQKLKDEFGAHVDVEWHQCDMGSLKAVRDTFTKIRDAQQRLDLVRSRIRNVKKILIEGFDSNPSPRT